MIASDDDSWTDGKAAWIAAVCAAGLTVFTAAVVVPLLKRHVDRQFDSNGVAIQRHTSRQQKAAANLESGEGKLESEPSDPKLAIPSAEEAAPKAGMFGKMKKAALHGLTFDIHAVVDEDEHLNTIHNHAEVFEPRIELSFSYLQVRTPSLPPLLVSELW